MGSLLLLSPPLLLVKLVSIQLISTESGELSDEQTELVNKYNVSIQLISTESGELRLGIRNDILNAWFPFN